MWGNKAKKEKFRELQKMKDKEHMLEILRLVFQHEAENAEKNVPEEGKFQRIICACNFMKEGQEAFVTVLRTSNSNNVCLVTLNMHRPLSDRIFTHYMLEGSKAEAVNWLRDEKNIELAFDELTELANKMENYYSEF